MDKQFNDDIKQIHEDLQKIVDSLNMMCRKYDKTENKILLKSFLHSVESTDNYVKSHIE